MKNTRFPIITITMAIAFAFNANAQRDNRLMERGVTSIINNDTANKAHVETVMRENAPQTPNDNGLPRFAIVGKERQYYLGIGAQFLGEGVFTWGDNNSSTLDFTPSSFTPSTAGNRSSLGFAWQSSSIYLNFVAMPGTNNKIGLFFKGKFNSDKTFKCSRFYAKYRGLTVGLTKSVFHDGAATPMTIDGGGPTGYPDLTVFTAYWQQKFSKHFAGAIGIDAPNMSYTLGTTVANVYQRIPSIPLYLEYDWNKGDSHLRLSGIVRPMQYRDLSESCNRALTGGGIQLSGITNIVGDLTFCFSAVYGNGLANYIEDDAGLGIDAVALNEKGKMAAVKNLGLTGGFTYNFSPLVSSNIVYSHATNWMPKDAIVDSSQFRYGDYVAANVIFNISKFISAGVEYDYGYRRSFGGEGLHANRLQCQLAVTF